jgi:tRNA (guanine37-N1)-methyltransferase
LGADSEHAVPDVLLSGHHQRIADWKQHQALSATFFNHPQLLSTYQPSQAEQIMLLSTLKGKERI